MEQNFQKDLVTLGVDYAFHKYAAENAVIKREKDTLVMGKEAIKKYYSNSMYKEAVAQWSPDFIDVSNDGSMAYTYGKYRWTFKDKEGKVTNYEGVFHTVWKRMPDGSWKYVWD
jgi:ketosteroid isomerase-like protein